MKNKHVVYLLAYYIILKDNFSESPAFNLINIPRLFPMDLPRRPAKVARPSLGITQRRLSTGELRSCTHARTHAGRIRTPTPPALMRRKFWESDGVVWAAGVYVRAG